MSLSTLFVHVNKYMCKMELKGRAKRSDKLDYLIFRMHIARVHEGRKVSLQCPVCDKNVVSLEWHLQQYHKTQDISEFINAAESENKPQIIGRGMKTYMKYLLALAYCAHLSVIP